MKKNISGYNENNDDQYKTFKHKKKKVSKICYFGKSNKKIFNKKEIEKLKRNGVIFSDPERESFNNEKRKW